MNLYLSNIEARDKRELTNSHFIDQYTLLADRLANSSQAISSTQPETTTSEKPGIPSSPRLQAPSDDIETYRTGLSTANKRITVLEAKLGSYSSLEQTSQNQTKHIESLERELVLTQRRLRDRTEEVKEQKKLVENVQDEMISQNLQLNVLEERNAKIKAENEELIKRWMEKMGQEADDMNRENDW